MFHEVNFVKVDGPGAFDEPRIIAYDTLTRYETIGFFVTITIFLNFVL